METVVVAVGVLVLVGFLVGGVREDFRRKRAQRLLREMENGAFALCFLKDEEDRRAMNLRLMEIQRQLRELDH